MILDEIAARTKRRIEEEKKTVPLERLQAQASDLDPNTGFPFERALRADGISFICEVKKASPSKGIIARDFPYLSIAKEYEAAGAAAVSVLTEPYYFLGSDEFLREITGKISIPALRKDFVVDEYMIYQAKLLGASAVLLICAVLDDAQLKSYLKTARALGLSALVEAYTMEEVLRAVDTGAHIIGVNNRDLKTFKVDMENGLRLRGAVPSDRVFVSESGIKTAQDIALLRESGADAVLIGEAFMRSADKKAALNALRGGSL